MKKVINKIFGIIAGRKTYQGFFEFLYQLSLRGMHIGYGASTTNSGEGYALRYIGDKLSAVNVLTIFDVGANVGEYSILVKEILKEKAKLFSFEPSKTTYRKLVANTKHLTNITHHNFGFGSEEAEVTLFTDADESGLASVYKRQLDYLQIEMSKTEDIQIRKIDNFCIENAISHIHLLKIDVEGHELKVLEGAKNLLSSKAVDFIQFEFGGCNIDSRTFFKDFYYLLKDDYHLYRIVKDGIYKLRGYQESYETFTTTNYLAERKGI